MSRVWVGSVSPMNLHGFTASQLSLSGLDEGLNVVFASNASGKSTLAKAIMGLFQPDDLDSGATVISTLYYGGVAQELLRSSKDSLYDGFPGRSRDYYLDLPSLLQGLGKDAGIAQIIGPGFDFKKSQKTNRPDTSKDTRMAKDLLGKLQEARRTKLALLTEEEKLPQMDFEVHEAEQAAINIESLQGLLKLKRLLAEAAAVSSEIEQLRELYPGLGDLTPDREEQLQEKRTRIAADCQRVIALERRVSQVGSGKAPRRSLLPSDEFELDELISECESHGRDAVSATTRSEILRRRVQDAGEQVFRLSPAGSGDAGSEVTAVHFEQIGQVASVADRAREETVRNNAFAKVLNTWVVGSGVTPADLERVQRRYLEWLAWKPGASANNVFVPVLVAAAGALVVSLLPNLILRVIVAIVASIIAVVLAKKPSAGPISLPPSLQDLPAAYSKSNPTPTLLAEALQGLLDERARLEVRKSLEDQATVSSEAADELARLKKSVDINCENPYQLAPLGNAIVQLSTARLDLEAATAEALTHSEQRDAAMERVNSLYADFDFECRTGHECAAKADFLSWHMLSVEREERQSEVESGSLDLHRFLDFQGIPSGADVAERIAEFARRIGPSKELKAFTEKARDCDLKIRMTELDEDRLRLCLGLSESEMIDQVTVATVEEQIARQDALAAQLTSRRTLRDDVRARVRLAERASDVSAAETAFRRSAARVEVRWEEASRDQIQFRVSEAIRDRLLTEDLPPLLLNASAILDRFSHGRYRVTFGSEPDEQIGILAVVDGWTGRTQKFRQLSTGTKVHALLSLKLALIEAQEDSKATGSMKFPLIADEPMAVSDPESSRAIAAAFVEIAKERQVIVFTSQDSDVALFGEIAPSVQVIGLNGVPAAIPVTEPISLARTVAASVGSRFDPRYPIGAQSVGALFGSTHPQAARRIDQGVSDEVAMMASVLENLKQQLDRDHPRVKWESCSQESWAMTNFSSTLRERLDEAVGCPHRFKEAVLASRGTSFRIEKVDSAIDWLESGGYLSPPPTLESIADRLRDALEGADATQLESIVSAFAEAYVPTFKPPSMSDPETPLKRKGRPAANPSKSPALFE